MKMTVSVVIPVYNEQDSIKEVVESLKLIFSKNKIKYEIIVINDSSTDNTNAVLQNIQKIKIINHPYNKGYGASLKTGIRVAKNNIIVMLDADATYPIESIPEMLRCADDYDIVSGARVGKNAQIPLLRKPAKFILSTLANFLTGKKIPDLNCGLRIIKKDHVKRFFNILPSRFSFTLTHLLACLTSEGSVKFIPIAYHRRKGKSSIHPIKDFIKFNTIIIRVITYFKPLRFFSLVSTSLLGLGFWVYVYNLIFMNKIIMDLTIIVLILSALQVFLFGLIADLIVKKISNMD